MHKPKFIFKAFFFLLAFSFTNSFAQTETKQLQAEPSYEIVLQIITASNKTNDKTNIPASLSSSVKKLKSLYNYSAYDLTDTFFQRTSNTVEHKSFLKYFVGNQDKNTPVFADWTLNWLRGFTDSQGRKSVQSEMFRFGARVPVTVQTVKEEGGKSMPVYNYESIGFMTTKFSVNENEPTIIGSLATAKPDELMFLILTVKSVE